MGLHLISTKDITMHPFDLGENRNSSYLFNIFEINGKVRNFSMFREIIP